MSEDSFGHHTCGGENCYWYLMVEARDAAEHPTNHRTVPPTKKYPAQISIVSSLRNPVLEGRKRGGTWKATSSVCHGWGSMCNASL